MNLRGQFTTGADGRYWFRSVKPSSYPIPSDGTVGRMLAALGRHPMRPAHVHFIITSPGYQTVTTHVFVEGDPYLDSDAVFGVKESLIAPFVRHDDPSMAGRLGVGNPFYTAEYDFALAKTAHTTGDALSVGSEHEGNSAALGHAVRMEGGDAARARLRPRRARPMDHRAAVPLHGEGPGARLSGDRNSRGRARHGLGRLRGGQRAPVRSGRTSEGAGAGGPAVLGDVRVVRPRHQPVGADSHPRPHGPDGRIVLSDQLRGDRRRRASVAPRTPAGVAAERIRALRFRSRADHRDTVARGRPLVALGVPR